MRTKKLVSFFLLFILLLSIALPASASKKSSVPLLDPQTVKYVKTKDDILNILFLGLDVSSDRIRASANKRTVMKSHTDVIMLLSINKTKNRMDLLSIPRDTLCYVPGVHGVYKMNAAFNTAKNYNEGFRHTKETVSWFLGGLKIDFYCALDLEAMHTFGDLMGGIDYDLEMSYASTDGKRKYKAGYQHLDGMGIVDYVRARKNATIAHDDMGRTNRNRMMMIAIFDKLKSDMNMINQLWAAGQKSTVNFFTDMSGVRFITDMWDFFQNIESADIGSYMIPGVYEEWVLGYWNLNITNQQERIRIIKELYGYTAKEIPYTSKAFCSWLLNGGFQATHRIRLARDILEYVKLHSNVSKNKELKTAVTALEKSIDAAVEAYDLAATKLQAKRTQNMNHAIDSMKTALDKVVKLSGYSKSYSWSKDSLWYKDKYIVDYPNIDWR